MFARFLADYGIVFVVLGLCAFFSVATMEDQHPTGATAAEEVARAIVSETAPGATVLIVVRTNQDDADFASALAEGLAGAGKVVLETVRGQPSEIRSALEKQAGRGMRVDVLASLQAVGVESILENVRRKYPAEFGPTRLVVPPSYTWPNFLKTSNLLNITNQIVVIAIIAIGMTMVIITGGIDLSVGSLMALSAVVTAVLIRDAMGGKAAVGSGLIAASLIAISICGVIGSITGILVRRFDIPPFICTLGMMLIARGLALRISRSESINEIPDSFMWLGRGADLGNIPNAVVLMLFLYLLAHVIMSRTVFGRYIYAVGGNAEAARLSGVPVARIIIAVYIITAVLAGVGGVIFASNYKSSNANYGLMYELYVIAAVVVGGTSLSGGEGKIFGTLLGAFLIAIIQNGMNLMGVESSNQMVVLGLVILGAVLLDRLKKQRLAM